MAINDTYFFTAQGLLQGRSYVHTLHFREGASVGAGNQAQNLINAWQGACQSAWLGAHRPNYTLTRLTAQRICGSPPLPSRVEEGVGLVGTRGTSGDELAGWLSVAVNEATGLAGKSRHGRFFMSGGMEQDVTIENLVGGATGWLVPIQAYVTALSTGFVGVSDPFAWQLVVHSRKLASVPGTQCNQSSEPVISLGVVSRLTTQRSRRA